MASTFDRRITLSMSCLAVPIQKTFPKSLEP
jgi:hypothetical protein